MTQQGPTGDNSPDISIDLVDAYLQRGWSIDDEGRWHSPDAEHEPTPFVDDLGAGVACRCGWEGRTRPDVGMRHVWIAYRKHWSETHPDRTLSDVIAPPCRVCGDLSYRLDDEGVPVHLCCALWAEAEPGRRCPACAASRRIAREAARREQRRSKTASSIVDVAQRLKHRIGNWCLASGCGQTLPPGRFLFCSDECSDASRVSGHNERRQR